MGSKKQTTKSDPFAPTIPVFNDTAGILKNYLKDPNANAVYDGQRTVGMSGTTRSGVDALGNNAGAGQARDYYSKVLNGDFLNPDNPYIKNLQDSITSAVMPGVNATFANSGTVGSTYHQGTLTKALTDGMAAPMFNNYQAERGYQNNAASALPSLDASDALAKIQAGQLGEGYEKEKVAADMAKWQEQQDAPLRALSKIYPYLSDMGKQGGTQTTKTSQSPAAQIAGGLMSVAGLASGMGWLGAGAGGLMSAAQASNLYNPYVGQGYSYSANPGAMGWKTGGV